jgi:hypothetical protein
MLGPDAATSSTVTQVAPVVATPMRSIAERAGLLRFARNDGREIGAVILAGVLIDAVGQQGRGALLARLPGERSPPADKTVLPQTIFCMAYNLLDNRFALVHI